MLKYSALIRTVTLMAATAVAPAGAATLNYGNDDFAGWIAQTFRGAGAGQTVALEATGGNPGANLLVTTVTGQETFTGHFNPATVLDPSQGAIESISAALDYLVVSAFGQGQGGGTVLLEQAGSYYFAGSFLTGSVVDGIWKTVTLDDAGFNQFGRLVGSGALDFSTAGAPIRLGFWTGNEAGNGITVRYDNWSASVSQVPAPPAFALALTAYAAAFGWTRRRRAK